MRHWIPFKATFMNEGFFLPVALCVWDTLSLTAAFILFNILIMSVPFLHGTVYILLYYTMFLSFDGYNFSRRYALHQQASFLAICYSVMVFVFFSLSRFFPEYAISARVFFWVGLSQYVLWLFGRKVYFNLLNNEKITEKIAIIGETWMGAILAKELVHRQSTGWRFNGFVHEDTLSATEVTSVIDARESRLDLSSGHRGDRMAKFITTQNLSLKRVKDVQDFYESMTRRVPIPFLKMHNKEQSEIYSPPDHRFIHETIGHVVNIFVALVGFILTLPLMALIAMAIKCDDGGPIFFKQPRIGYQMKPFHILKFRTMVPNASSLKNKDIEHKELLTRVGKWLRRCRLDEIPQFLNILKRDINIVGPRPFIDSETQYFEKNIPFFKWRYQVRPGITGLAQVSHRYENELEDARVKLGYDLYYVKNHGFFLDFLICLWSISTVLLGKGR